MNVYRAAGRGSAGGGEWDAAGQESGRGRTEHFRSRGHCHRHPSGFVLHSLHFIKVKGAQTFALSRAFWLYLHLQAWLKTRRGRRTGFLTRTSVAVISASVSLTPVSPSITAGPADRACVTAALLRGAPYRLAAGTIPYACASRAARKRGIFSRIGYQGGTVSGERSTWFCTSTLFTPVKQRLEYHV